MTPAFRGADPRHVAEAIIAVPRDATAAELVHLDACPACRSALRRGASFDRQLADATSVLSPVTVPREVLAMPTPSIRRPSMPSVTSLSLIAALVVAAGLVAWNVLPLGLPPSAGAGIAASATLPPDPHLVVIDGATWRIGMTGTSIEVHRSNAPGAADELLVAWDLGTGLTGSSGASLRCPRPGGGDDWAVLGRLTPKPRIGQDPSEVPLFSPSSGPILSYVGPPAHGQAAPDGLFLYVIAPATFDPGAAISVSAPGGGQKVGFGGLVASDTDVRQPSGCFFSG